MSSREFTVYTYKSETDFLKSLVKLKDNIETGGDLFGLWLDESNVVIQLINGPGQNCRRTITSFYQDVDYLENVGTHLTTKEGLCNVGEWHSHHRLGLPRPSARDEQTVWRSMPVGITKFVLFIANISGPKKGKPQVNVGCFLFDKVTNEVVSGELKDLSDACSPLRKKTEVQNVLENGAERMDIAPGGKKANQARKEKSNRRENEEVAKQTRRNKRNNGRFGQKRRGSPADIKSDKKDNENKKNGQEGSEEPIEDKMKEQLADIEDESYKETKISGKVKVSVNKESSETKRNEVEDSQIDTKLRIEEVGAETKDHKEGKDKKADIKENKEAELKKNMKTNGDEERKCKPRGEARETKPLNEKKDVTQIDGSEMKEQDTGLVKNDEKDTQTEKGNGYRPKKQGRRKSEGKRHPKQKRKK